MAEKKLCRSEKNKILGGVCGGIAEYYGWDPTLVRLGWVFLTIMGGGGIVLYIAAWLIMPQSPEGKK
ncbi:MAG: PspC domain-containing protein [Candidatus Anstonellaceae archaeon]